MAGWNYQLKLKVLNWELRALGNFQYLTVIPLSITYLYLRAEPSCAFRLTDSVGDYTVLAQPKTTQFIGDKLRRRLFFERGFRMPVQMPSSLAHVRMPLLYILYYRHGKSF